MSKKNNIIPFPAERIKGSKEEKAYEEANTFEECVSLAQYLFDILDAGTKSPEVEEFLINFDAKEEGTQAHKDMWVILNLLAAILVRNKKGKHFFIDELDYLYKKLLHIDRDGLYPADDDHEIYFSPEFDIPLDNDEGGLLDKFNDTLKDMDPDNPPIKDLTEEDDDIT